MSQLPQTSLLTALAAFSATFAIADEPLHPFAATVGEQLADPSQPFVLLVNFSVKADQVDAFIEAAAEPRRETAKEPGNVSYALSQSVETPTDFVLYEHWESVAALDFHLKQPYLTKLLGSFETTLAEPPKLTVSTPVPLP